MTAHPIHGFHSALMIIAICQNIKWVSLPSGGQILMFAHCFINGLQRPLSDPERTARLRRTRSFAVVLTRLRAEELTSPHCEFVEQRLCLSEIGSVKAFDKPAVDGCEELAGFILLSLGGQKASEADRSSQLEPAGTLISGDRQGCAKTGLDLRLVVRWQSAQELAAQSMKLRISPMSAESICVRKCSGDNSQAIRDGSVERQGLRQITKDHWIRAAYPGCSHYREALMDPFDGGCASFTQSQGSTL